MSAVPAATREPAGPPAAADWARIEAAAPAVAAVMRRYLRQLAVFLAPASVDAADNALRHLARWMVTETGLRAVGDIRRDHIEDFKVWLAARPRGGGRLIIRETHRQRMRTVRAFFERIIEWDWPDALPRNPVIAGDIPKKPEPLPKFPGDRDAARLMAAARAASEWTRKYGIPVPGWNLPGSEKKQDELAVTCAKDGYALLRAVYDKASPAWLAELPAVETLRKVLVQNYTLVIHANGREVARRREKQPEGDGIPPGRYRIASPYDTDARWGAKRDENWLGYKLHVTETCDDAPPCGCPGPGHDGDCDAAAFPNLVTCVATTSAAVTDTEMTGAVDDALAAKGLAPGRHYPGSGYLSAGRLVAEAARHGIALTGPLQADTSAQARAGQGYARADFSAGYDAQRVTCPQGKTSSSWSPCSQYGRDAIVAIFARSDCEPCPVRELCTKGKKRTITLPPRAVAEAQAALRAAGNTKSFQADYARRAGVEGTMHQAASRGARRARYRGLRKTRLDHAFMAVALNLLRLNAYWNGNPLDRARTSHLARLELNLAA